MPARLALVIGSFVAVLLLWCLIQATGDASGASPRVEVAPATAAGAEGRSAPIELEPVRGREALEDEEGRVSGPPVPRDDVSPPSTVAIVDDEHWIEGRAMLADGTPITGFRVAALEPAPSEPAARERSRYVTGWDPLASDILDELGRFRIGPVPEGTYDVRLDPFDAGWVVDAVERVEAPTTTAELRLDGLFVVLEAPNEAWQPTGPGARNARLEISSKEGRVSMSGSKILDENGRFEHLLHAGVRHDFKYTSRNGRLFSAALDESTPPGRHHVWLEEVELDPGTIRVVYRSGRDRPDVRLLVTATPEASGSTPTAVPPRAESFLLDRRKAKKEHDEVYPGRYTLSAKVFSNGETEWSAAVARPAAVEVQSGEVSEVEVELIEGGRLEVSIESGPGEDSAEVLLEVRDAGTGDWTHAIIQNAATDAPASERASGHLSLETANVARQAFPPGLLRVRLRGEGWRTVEGTVTIVAGETTSWRPRLERE
ncbi:MAG: hypothetical protein AAF957_01545 [Planctomycetota bacterium]